MGDKIDQNLSLNGVDASGLEGVFNLGELLKSKRLTVLYFYPKDATPGCTTEACDFRDSFNRLSIEAQVVGVSADPPGTHVKFHKKQSLNFPLLSDPERKLMEPLAVWGEKKMYGKVKMGIIRSTFLLDQKGMILQSWRNIRVKGHVDKVLEAIEATK